VPLKVNQKLFHDFTLNPVHTGLTILLYEGEKLTRNIKFFLINMCIA